MQKGAQERAADLAVSPVQGNGFATDTLFPLEESRNNRIEISSIKTLGIINYNGTYERKC